MAKKGYISETVGGGRIVSHGQVTDLSRGFKLPDGGTRPFVHGFVVHEWRSTHI